ncbi:MAG: sugar transferase [Patescibacteria group bacterium]|nr:sugar transferase [Patescibacteria group bacterium]MDD4304264.1 sugar transferase [Patescibacteria group bacterium]MDD4695318.1 sugar transferase [Patescibacteria group bacterium]
MFTNINKIRFKKIILLIGDMFFLYFSLFLTLLLRFKNNYTYELLKEHIYNFSILYIFWIIMIFSFRLYEANKPITKTTTLAINILNFSIINFFISVLYFYIKPNVVITPKTVLIINIFVFAAIFYIWRILINKIIYKGSKSKNCLLITNNTELIKDVAKNLELELNVKTYVNPSDEINNSEIEKIQLNNINYYIKQNNIQTIIIDDALLESKRTADQLFECIKLRLEIIKASDFYEKFLGKVSISNINQLWFISNLNENAKYFSDFIKNVLDKILSIIFIIISILLSPFIILLIKIDSRGPVLFRQIRTGKNNKKFMAMKFRTMNIDAEKDGPQWSKNNDPRVTKIGNFLRISRLDEIPQFINILKGEMSLIGPRPERPEFVKELREKIDFYDQRLLVKPGLTGWAQINYPYGSSVEDAYEKLQYDLYYVKNRSLILDLSIILKTIHTITKKLIGKEL